MRPYDDRRIPRLDREQALAVQSLLVRAPDGPAVRHVLLRVPAGTGRGALAVLHAACPVSFGLPERPRALMCSVGFTFEGLEALRLPPGYVRVFQRLAPSFRTGAVRRSPDLGDSGPSSAANWHASFQQDRAHAVVSWHGTEAAVDAAVNALREGWHALLPESGTVSPDEYLTVHGGERLDAPPGQVGHWAHFGFRDDVSEVVIDQEERWRVAPDQRPHAPGALLLGWPDDEGLNRFSLVQAPDKVRLFFRSASFGVLRKMAQDIGEFEAQVAGWQQQVTGLLGPLQPHAMTSAGPAPDPSRPTGVHPDFVKAKLCGRWPDGRALRPGATRPPNSATVADHSLDLYDLDAAGHFKTADARGTGCPFASHVRRMQAVPDDQGNLLVRPLLRRSVPFGKASFDRVPDDNLPRGQLGHFFCASLESQFEHLLGQWGARPPLGSAATDDARDPLMGPHDDPDAGFLIALEGSRTQKLTGFRRCTTTLGMAYAWYPGSEGWRMLINDDFVPKELAGPWL